MTDMPIEHSGRDPGFTPEAAVSGGKRSIPRETAWRSFAKAISWRVLGTLDTFFLSFMIIKYIGPVFGLVDEHSDLEIAATASLIAITEIVTKIFIYTVHERLWNLVQWGVASGRRVRHETRFRSFIKMSTWRVLASLDTMLLAWLFTGNLATAISIGSFEVLTKLVLYFIHERVWLRIKIGLDP